MLLENKSLEPVFRHFSDSVDDQLLLQTSARMQIAEWAALLEWQVQHEFRQAPYSWFCLVRPWVPLTEQREIFAVVGPSTLLRSSIYVRGRVAPLQYVS